MSTIRIPALTLACAALIMACTPTVRVEAPTEPITINLNVKIEHEIRLKVEQAIDELITEDAGLF